MTGKLLIVQATFLAVVSGFSVIHSPFFKHQPFVFQQPIGYQQPLPFHQPIGVQQPFTYQQPIVSGWRQLELRSIDKNLPCPAPGFFVHPGNCTRFYRCVDYAGTGYLFSRYLFECPTNHIFITAAQTCLPGSCEGLDPQPVVAPPTPAPVTVGPTAPPSTEDTGITTWPSVTPDPSSSSDSTPEAETESSTSEVPTVTPITDDPLTEAPATDPPVPANPVTQECSTSYVQHAQYCNIYHPCNQPDVRYVCPGGTAFDQPRQMCRIMAQDDVVCTGKAVFEHPILLRTENIGAHVLLPADLILPTVHSVQTPFQQNPDPSISYGWPQIARPGETFGLPTASPEQLYLWPNANPLNFHNNPENQDSFNFSPVLKRPFQPTSFNNPQPVLNAAAPFFREKPRPVEQVRRPFKHLHFPQYILPELFGPHGDISLP